MSKQFHKKFRNRSSKRYQPAHDKKQTFYNRREDKGFPKKHGVRIIKESLREDQVGITEYINRGEGFKGILKSRFSDFHVNEIDLNGEILHLNDLTIPEEKEEELSLAEVNAARDELKNVITEDAWNQMDQLKEAKHNEKPEASAIYIDVTELDKEQRTQAHKVIKKLYENKLVSSTVSGEQIEGKEKDKKFIRIMKAKGRDRNKWLFPKEYVHFLVHKENLDTSEVASVIAYKMNIRPSQVNYCGTKDKRGKTTQKFCIKKRTPRQIVGTVKHLNGVKIGNFKFEQNVLKLGDLDGNRFRIVIRNLIGERCHIEASLNNMKEQGFINYFGLQRFGNCSAIPTYEIGVALLKADYKLACELILKPRDNDAPYFKKIREMWWETRDSKAAAAEFRNDGFIEKKLLDGLAQFGENDYAAALRRIPRNMLLLYPHAFQSLIFNHIASKRIKEFGLALIPGDLVYRNRDSRDIEFESTELPESECDIEKKLDSENGTTSTENENRCNSIYKTKVRALTEEDITSGAYSIYDVLLSLPGYDITYPENVVGSWYKELMEKYELSSEKLKHNVKMFAMAGAYRRLVVRPSNMSWEFKSYSDPEETLILSDLELLQGKRIEDFQDLTKDKKYEALLLDFCLPTASYATMMLRELLKCDTSTAAQSLLQNEALKEHIAVNKISVDTDEMKVVDGKRRTSATEDDEQIIKHQKLTATAELTDKSN